jgi:anti-anti-sigma regulatory factor
MKENDLLISSKSGCYTVTVSGRANFEYAVPLRDLARSTAEFSAFRFDMKNCTAMDSTFMGVLTMLALKAKKSNIVIDICNANDTLKKLLRDLGVAKLFEFKELESSEGGVSGKEKRDMLTTAETVEEAHRALADLNEENADKFKDVIEFSHQDVERLKQNKQ